MSINGKEITKTKDILKQTNLFYSKLYTHDNIDVNDINEFFGERENIIQLNDTQRQSCEGLLTENECATALLDMQNNKSPGSDGITTEFYKIFWQDLKVYLLNSINYSFENKTLTDLQKQGIINLIPKKDKELTSLNNWRPISLLNIDYKIATKAIANRIKNVLPSIIHKSQTGFVKSRYIGENIRLLYETIDNLNENNNPGLLFFADFEKAFDSLNHTFLMKTLDSFNFGSSLKQWIFTFYNGIKSCVSNNGHLSDFFDIERGVRQGCPLSPYLFIISIEMLSIAVRSNNSIKGITVANEDLKNTMFADDATFITDGTKQSFEKLVETIDKFSSISGLKLNIKKSIILRIGSLKDTSVVYCKRNNFTWTSDKACTLGMIFTNKKTQTT